MRVQDIGLATLVENTEILNKDFIFGDNSLKYNDVIRGIAWAKHDLSPKCNFATMRKQFSLEYRVQDYIKIWMEVYPQMQFIYTQLDMTMMNQSTLYEAKHN